jgi:hypothetical protein
MDAPVVSRETTMKEYREVYNKNRKEFLSAANLPKLREAFCKILDVIETPRR